MPNTVWKYADDCVALPTTHTTASQPVTGNGSLVASWSTRPTSWRRASGLRSAARSSVVSGCSGLIGILLRAGAL